MLVEYSTERAILNAHRIQLVAEVYGVDVVAFEIGEHDDLRNGYF